MSSSPQVLDPAVLAGRYRIDGRLDTGATSVVYRAFDTRLRRTVAIKVLDRRLSATGNTRALREARAASALAHPNVCTVHEVDEADGQAFIVMEHVAGRRLDRAIPPGVGLPVETVLDIGGQVADALAHAHEHAVLHRDLKPANIVIADDGRVKVLDFGLALEREWATATDTRTDVGDAPVAGTPGYISPEVLTGHAADERSDVWALGVLLFELATGDRPFAGRTSFEIASAVLRGPAPRLPARVPAGLAAIIRRCLQMDPAKRYQSAAEVRAAADAARVVPGGRTKALGMRTGAAVLVALVLVGALAAWLLLRQAGPARPLQTIAVIPMIESGAGDANYIADGLAESVIDALAGLPNPRLNVVALTSVLRYKGSRIDMDKVARELRASAVLALRVSEHDSVLSVDAELIELQGSKHLWGERYQEEQSNLALLPDRLAAQICESLRIQLTQDQREHLRKRYSDNREGYRLYLLGRHEAQQAVATADGYDRAIDYFQQAIAKDPGFALAYDGLADTYASIAFDGWRPSGEAFGAADKALAKAIALDPDLPDLHKTLAGIRWGRDWNWAAAAHEYERGVAAEPGLVEAHRFYGVFLRAMGRWDEALQEIRRALDIDPLGVQTNITLGTTYHWQHREAEAIEQYRRTLELQPDSAAAHDLMADALERVNREGEALTHRQLALRLAGQEEEATLLARDAATVGYQVAMRQYFRRSLGGLLEAARSDYVAPMAVAMAAIGAGDTSVAFEWLNRAFDERHPWMTMLKTDPAFDPLRSDARFARLMARMRLPE